MTYQLTTVITTVASRQSPWKDQGTCIFPLGGTVPPLECHTPPAPRCTAQDRADLTEGYCYHHPSSPSSEGAVFRAVCHFGWGEDHQEDEEVAVVGLRMVLLYGRH